VRTRRLWGRCAIALVALLGILALPTIARASSLTLYDNTSLDGSWTSAAGVQLAQSFSTGSDPVDLSSVSFFWRNASEDNSTSVASSYTLELFLGSGGVPTSLVATLASDVSVETFAQSTDSYSTGSPLALAPNSQYFVVVSGDSGGTLGWKFNPAAPNTGVSPTPTHTSLSSSDGGSTWTSLPGNFIMSVTGTTLIIPTLSGFPNISATPGQAPDSFNAPSASAPGTFEYESSNSAVASIGENQITFGAVGSATITANFYPSDQTTFYPTSITATVTVAAPPPPPPPSPPSVVTTTTSTSTTTTTTTTLVTPTTKPSSTSSGSSKKPGHAPTRKYPTTTTSFSVAASTTTTTAPSATPTTSDNSTTPTAPPASSTKGPITPSTALPSPLAPDPSIFNSTDGSQFVAQIDAVTGDSVAGTPVTVRSIDGDPNSAVTVEVHSSPQIILNGSAGSTGTYSGTAALPDSLEPGEHVLIIRAIYQGQPVTLVGAFIKTDVNTFATIVQPTEMTNYSGTNDPRLLRALRFGLPVYDVASHPQSTAGLVVAGGSLLALAGATGAASLGAGAFERRKSQHQSKVASAVTKKLKAVRTDHLAWGDRSLTWQSPHTERLDRLSRELPVKIGPFSALIPRVIVDGSWLRAAFGGWSMVLWVVGLALGVLSGFFHSAAPFVPAIPLIFMLIALGIFDTIACAIAWATIAITSIVDGSIEGWSDIRTLLGLGVLLVTVPLLAHAIRPLRRYLLGDVSERWERLFDYIMMPIFVAFAAASMAKALDGLSGLTILSVANLGTIRWIVGISIVVRLACEDLALHFYPERSKAVQPEKLVSPRLRISVGSLVFKFLLYLIVMDPYFGFTPRTVIAATLLAIPGILKLCEEKLPNFKLLHRWLPRGLTSFLFMMILGSFLSFHLLGLDPTPGTVDSMFLVLLIPGVAIGSLEVIGREGVNWTNVWMRRCLGVVVWLAAVGIVTGHLVLFK
jgi:hypothetical protein